jgi:hypothetical protein
MRQYRRRRRWNRLRFHDEPSELLAENLTIRPRQPAPRRAVVTVETIKGRRVVVQRTRRQFGDFRREKSVGGNYDARRLLKTDKCTIAVEAAPSAKRRPG